MPHSYKELIIKKMFEKDMFSKALGMKIIDIDKGQSTVELTVQADMCNGFGIAHGGIAYSLADSALAFASNTYDGISLSIETSISHLAPVKVGDKLLANAREISRSRKIGVYEVVLTVEETTVAHFKGTVYCKG